MGTASGYLCVLVLALYINSPDVGALYHRPKIIWLLCVVMLYWISRLWVVAQRGKLHDDPVIYALTDRVSLMTGVLAACIVAAARSASERVTSTCAASAKERSRAAWSWTCPLTISSSAPVRSRNARRTPNHRGEAAYECQTRSSACARPARSASVVMASIESTGTGKGPGSPRRSRRKACCKELNR